MGPDFTFFVVYGSVSHLVDLREVTVVEREYPLLTAKEVNLAIKRQLRRKLVVVGACIGTDAHTVGIDAILNIKGFAGRRAWSTTARSGWSTSARRSSSPSSSRRPAAERADAVLVSQVVTQKDAHIHNTTADVRRVPRGLPRGPGADPHGRRSALRGGSAAALGVDRIFGRGTTPGEVASYLVHARSPAAERQRALMSPAPPRIGRPSRHAPALRSPTATPTTPGTSSTLVEGLSWRWIFLVNVPIGLAALVVARLRLRESRDPAPSGVDLRGVALLCPALFLLVYALIWGKEE